MSTPPFNIEDLRDRLTEMIESTGALGTEPNIQIGDDATVYRIKQMDLGYSKLDAATKEMILYVNLEAIPNTEWGPRP